MKKPEIKRYNCFNMEEQSYYAHLTELQRAYVDYRGQGYNKADASRLAGYNSKNPGRNGYVMESKNPTITVLINKIIGVAVASRLALEENTKESKQVDILADHKENLPENMVGTGVAIAEMDGETARRIKFFRDITTGKIKTIKEIKEYNGNGNLVKRRTEQIDDVETRMKARRELDRLLGFSQLVNLGSVQCGGDITINIVDASKKDSKSQSVLDGGTIDINEDDVKTDNDGTRYIVTETDEKTEGKQCSRMKKT